MQVNTMMPTSGPLLSPVHLNGSGFMSVTNPTYSITVNGVQASPISVLSDTDIDFCIPQGASTGDVQVSDGTNSADAGTFTVTDSSGAPIPFEPLLDDNGNPVQEQ